jgi:hypothetical protein
MDKEPELWVKFRRRDKIFHALLRGGPAPRIRKEPA